MTKSYVNANGGYLFSFDGNVEGPEGSTEVPSAPQDARQVWDFAAGEWGAVPQLVPTSISDRQFFQQMAALGLISQEEALDAVGSGAIPAAMEALIDQLPEALRFSAKMLIRGAGTFRRDHEMTSMIGSLYGMTEAQIDDLWRSAAEL